MSKIGRKPIPFTSAKVEVVGNKVLINGVKAKFEHELPDSLLVAIDGKTLVVSVKKDLTKTSKSLWGLHRALLANKIKGAEEGFVQNMKIVGLGYKGVLSGRKITFSLGYSHKVEFDLPDGVDVEIDRKGQMLTFKCPDKFILGNVCATVRSFRPPEPYKGTGIMREGEVIIRKAGKTKAA